MSADARAKLQTAFITALAESFANGGIDALERCRKEAPADYLRIVAPLLPDAMKAALLTIQAIDAAKRGKP